MSALVRETAEPRTRVAIVGGGIAGLYCAFELANRHGFESTVLEAAPRFGGRIETRKMGEFKAEFGPMRFEPNIQPLLTALVKQLQLDREWGEFTGTSIDEAAARSWQRAVQPPARRAAPHVGRAPSEDWPGISAA